MNYYIISQDKRIDNFVNPMGISKIITKEMLEEENLYKINEAPVSINIEENEKSEYMDFIESPYPIVSDKLKVLLKKYDENIFFKPVVFNNIKKMKQTLYWIIVPETLDCLSTKSEFNKDDTIKRLVIDDKKAFPYKIFKVNGLRENFIIITLDVVESILRRDFQGIKFEKLERE